MAKQKQKNARKHLRVQCGNCGNTQDSLRVQCSSCKADLHPDVSSQDLARIKGDVEALEEALVAAENPGANPYGPVDTAYQQLKALDLHPDYPGLQAYLAAVRQKLLPFKIALLQRTLKANLVFLVVLTMFPIVPLLVGWPPLLSGLMTLPVLVWGGISVKAYLDLQKAQRQRE